MRILINGNIHTLDPACPKVEAIALDQGRVLATGSRDFIEAEFGVRGQAENLEGKTVLPGLTDAHIHFRKYARNLQKVNCETDTLAACLANVRSRALETPPGEWVLGHGWHQDSWPDCSGGLNGFPIAAMLDAISREHPIYLTAKSLHAGWANSLALNLAGIDASTGDPEDGALQRDPAGIPSGILFEGAMRLVNRAQPPPSEEQILREMSAAQRRLWSLGLTGIHDFDRRRCFVALQILRARGELRLRVHKTLPVADLEHAIGLGLRFGFGDEMLWIGNVKAFADGALGPHTAAMLQPYEDDPGNVGMLLMDAEEIQEHGQKAALNGLGMTVHAIGDRANHEVLNAYRGLREFERSHGLPAYRHRIEHVQCLHPGDLGRLAELNVIASMQPIHATSDMRAADRFWGNRSAHAYAWNTLLSLGTPLAFGSDAPVDSPNPFWGLHAAVTRTRHDGSPGPDGWYPEQRISFRDALLAYTQGAAFTAGAENRLGSLSPGYCADLIVLERDPFVSPPDTLKDIRPTMTMVAGEWVYQSEEAS